MSCFACLHDTLHAIYQGPKLFTCQKLYLLEYSMPLNVNACTESPITAAARQPLSQISMTLKGYKLHAGHAGHCGVAQDLL